MTIPSRAECLTLMDRFAMPPHIQKHSLLVAEIALYLSRQLAARQLLLDLRIIEAGALLHDIAKMRSIATGEPHAELGAEMLTGLGYPVLAPLVKDHVTMDQARIHGPITESVLVNYADKRVKHDQIVTIEERFEDLVDRYAKTAVHRTRLLEKLTQYQALERRIFNRLPIGPTEAELMSLSAAVDG